MSCACIFDAWSVPCFRVEFRSVPVRSVLENRDALEKSEKSAWYPLFAHARKDPLHFLYNLSRYVRGSYNGKICGKYTTSAWSKMALKYRCRFCLSFEDAKHATNLFTVEAKHANLLGRLGPIFFVDRKQWGSIACM